MRTKSDWQKIYDSLIKKAESTTFEAEAKSFMDMANHIKEIYLKKECENSLHPLFRQPIFQFGNPKPIFDEAIFENLIKAMEKAKEKGLHFEGPLGGPYKFFKKD